MKYQIRFSIFLTILFFNISDATAQLTGITTSHDTVYLHITGEDSDGNGDSTCGSDISLENTTGQNVPLKWVKNVITNSQPTWHFHVCDVNNCYTPAVDSAVVTLTADGSPGPYAGITYFTVGFDDENGTVYDGYAEVEFTISKVDDPSDFKTVLFIFDSQSPTSIKEEEVRLDLSVFPNPSNGIINVTGENISSISKLKVYDLIGEEKMKMSYNNDGKFDISALNSGVYIILMLDQNNKILHRETVSKF